MILKETQRGCRGPLAETVGGNDEGGYFFNGQIHDMLFTFNMIHVYDIYIVLIVQ